MNKLKLQEASQMVGLRSPLRDDPTFVGRGREVNKIRASLLGTQVNSIWIWGPRRIGKTSLSYHLPMEGGLTIIRASCDKCKWSGIDSLIEFIAAEGQSQLNIKFNSSGKELLIELAGRAEKSQPIILILDEVDQIAINLEQYEQAFLRATLQNNPYFGIVFISRVRPGDLLQDYSDESSRLVGVCEIIRVPMLSRDEVSALVKIVEKHCGERFPEWLTAWIYDRVCGYSVCVQALLREFLILCYQLDSIPSEIEVRSHSHAWFEAISSDLFGLWGDLSLNIRKVLLGAKDKFIGTTRRELITLKLATENEPLLPSWLIEIGTETGILAEPRNLPGLFGLATKLSETLELCNEISLRKGGNQFFQTTQQLFKLFHLARPVANEADLNERINLLYKICIESTSSDKLPKENRCLIPEGLRSIYKKSVGFETLSAWRNFSFHDPSHDLEQGNSSKRYTNIGKICCGYLGPARHVPIDENDYNKIYQGVLADIVDSVDFLRKAIQEMD